MHKAKGFFATMAIAGLALGSPDALAADRESLDARLQQAKTVECDVQCGDVITQHTKLTHDLSCPGTDEPALRVEGDGIVLDLGGHTVSRSGPVQRDTLGIVVASDSMVRNGTIRGFQRGVQTQGAAYLRLHALTFADNGAAVYNFAGNYFLVTNSRFIGNGAGFSSEIDASAGTFDVRSSHFENNRLAIYLDSHTADVLNSTFTSNEVVVYCFAGSARIRSSTLSRNQAVVNAAYQFQSRDICDEIRFEGSIISSNTALGPTEAPAWKLARFAMLDTLVVGNGSGLTAETWRVYAHGNTFWNNAGGLTLADSPIVSGPQTGIVRANRFLNNAGDGLRVLPPSKPTVIGNLAVGNTGWGIHAPTAYDGGGNVARNNGAGQCEGVTCTPF
ncbi:right-handed parallel beta-helix repeat-containing protein [Corallococcus aberystwythensis]|uniref:Right-handed parallel beta-helix repeat-containing protein n=1 Tax=Corallococcus aberystwythensis TaxID=2316722 RepID=A0A3A8QAQ2_9BACT|nr:right-handed parallel beta-helix repeat-containing protein [Corallococcus aberystwythensis]RKH65759.1 right-handed parallel beta-helix repeat-containing protein [Corallococcus aberystwythensis]